ncbi:MAG: MBL fold metallo-hydrolase, partial [Candidatus Neomarinimicrobiota bacterium]|nr:MBL fold metallo-hydrolase [Candidatus Neomarinimicrobiota bacterium]
MTDILKELLLTILITMFCSLVAESKNPPDDRPYAVVLGIAQDGGYPHAGCVKLCCKDLWDNKTSYREKVSSIAIIDPRTRLAWIIDATPDFHEQLHTVTQKHSARLAGIFITHAHIGHYTGLMHLGREVMGAKNITVYAMPRMKRFLEKNGPWNQLVELNNIQLNPIKDQKEIILGKQLIIEPFRVPHRDEYSETVGFTIIGPNESMIYIPDIDKWDRWEHNISLWIEQHSYALLDGTFY